MFAVAGERHVRQAARAISYLKRMTRQPILLVQARSNFMPAHDQVLQVDVPPDLTDHQAGIAMKVSLHDRLAGSGGDFCYLDSDVIATGPVDEVFSQRSGPVAFAADHSRIDHFSRHAVRCGCTGPCPHLRERIAHDLRVTIPDPAWRMWNGGVFLFGQDSGPFMRLWRDLTFAILKNPFWQTRDQGTLAAAAWHVGLQAQPLLPERFNTLVDRFKGIPEADRAGLPVERFTVRRDEAFALEAPSRPAFLHFINGGVGHTGWANWDAVENDHARFAS